MKLKRYIFVYSYLIRLILKKFKKKRKIAYLSLFIKRFSYLLRDSITLEFKDYVYQAIVKNLYSVFSYNLILS